MDEVLSNLKRFAEQHSIELVVEGECGFGRPCVGFVSGENYIDHNPLDSVNYDPIPGFEDDELYAPDGVDAYHKHNCLAVLVHNGDYEEGLRQLNKWINDLERKGTLEIAEYKTGATGFQALISGVTGKVIRFTEKH